MTPDTLGAPPCIWWTDHADDKQRGPPLLLEQGVVPTELLCLGPMDVTLNCARLAAFVQFAQGVPLLGGPCAHPVPTDHAGDKQRGPPLFFEHGAVPTELSCKGSKAALLLCCHLPVAFARDYAGDKRRGPPLFSVQRGRADGALMQVRQM